MRHQFRHGFPDSSDIFFLLPSRFLHEYPLDAMCILASAECWSKTCDGPYDRIRGAGHCEADLFPRFCNMANLSPARHFDRVCGNWAARLNVNWMILEEIAGMLWCNR